MLTRKIKRNILRKAVGNKNMKKHGIVLEMLVTRDGLKNQ